MMKLREKSGASIVIVLAITFMVLAIGASVLLAASDTSSAMLRRQEHKICFRLAKDAAQQFTRLLKAESSAVGTRIAQSVYDSNPDGGSENVEFSDVDVKLVPEISGVSGGEQKFGWIRDAIEIERMTATDVSVSVVQPYIPAQEPAEQNGELLPGAPEVPMRALVDFKLTLRLAAKHRGAVQIICADYAFSGTSAGAGSGPGIIDSGRWRCLGFYIK